MYCTVLAAVSAAYLAHEDGLARSVLVELGHGEESGEGGSLRSLTRHSEEVAGDVREDCVWG